MVASSVAVELVACATRNRIVGKSADTTTAKLGDITEPFLYLFAEVVQSTHSEHRKLFQLEPVVASQLYPQYQEHRVECCVVPGSNR